MPERKGSTRTEWRTFVRKELALFLQFFLIGFFAATVGAFSWAIRPGEDISLLGLLTRMGTEFYGPWFWTFAGLSLLRFLLLLILRADLRKTGFARIPKAENSPS